MTFCPMTKTIIVESDAGMVTEKDIHQYEKLSDCRGEECGWWDGENEVCAILHLRQLTGGEYR